MNILVGMKKIFLFLFILSMSLKSWSQILVYKGSGVIANQKNTVLTPNLVRIALTKNPDLLHEYNIGRRKLTIGNTLLIAGPIVLGVGTMAYVISGFDEGMNPEFEGKLNRSIPKIIMGTGFAALLIAIPVRIGFSRKIKNVVAEYNNQNATGYKQFESTKVDLITNSNGIGLRLTLN